MQTTPGKYRPSRGVRIFARFARLRSVSCSLGGSRTSLDQHRVKFDNVLICARRCARRHFGTLFHIAPKLTRQHRHSSILRSAVSTPRQRDFTVVMSAEVGGDFAPNLADCSSVGQTSATLTLTWSRMILGSTFLGKVKLGLCCGQEGSTSECCAQGNTATQRSWICGGPSAATFAWVLPGGSGLEHAGRLLPRGRPGAAGIP